MADISRQELVTYELPRPARLPDGSEPEARIVASGVSWGSYLELDHRLGQDRSAPRIYYLAGELELMTTSREHERIKEWIGGLLDLFFDAAGIESMPFGQATLRLPFEEVGAEPDKSWCIGEEKPVPDFILEIALSSGGIPKLEIYRRFRIPEVWIWRNKQLEIYELNSAGHYERLAASKLLVGFDADLLQRCMQMRSWSEARKSFRAALGNKT